MSGRTVKAVTDMEIDEISLVDRPANQHAAVMIAKAYQGAEMPAETEYFWMDGTPLAEDDEIGPDDEVRDAEGNVYKLSEEAIAELEAEANAGELVGAGAGIEKRSAFGRSTQRTAGSSVAKSLAEELRETLAKSAGDAGTRETLTKALEAIEKADERATNAEKIAKAEQELRLDKEYVEVAKSYGALPVDATVLGPILKRCAQLLPEADCVILDKAFAATGEILFEELGLTGGGEVNGADPMAVAEAAVDAEVAKNADGKLSKAAGVEKFFSANPQAYDEYMAARAGH